MNKVILMGRLTRDPEVRYSQSAQPLAIARYSLAVNKRYKRDGEPDADFINCVAFGKTGEFAEKYFQKGQMVAVSGRLSVNNWEDKDGNKRSTLEVVVEDQYFAESKKAFDGSHSGSSNSYNSNNNSSYDKPDDFASISEPIDDEIPF